MFHGRSQGSKICSYQLIVTVDAWNLLPALPAAIAKGFAPVPQGLDTTKVAGVMVQANWPTKQLSSTHTSNM